MFKLVFINYRDDCGDRSIIARNEHGITLEYREMSNQYRYIELRDEHSDFHGIFSLFAKRWWIDNEDGWVSYVPEQWKEEYITVVDNMIVRLNSEITIK